jgi:Uma2 family endonuclease
MTAATLPARITYEEFKTFPDDGRRCELIDGEVFMFASPSLLHQMLALELAVLLRDAVTLRDLGWVLVAPFEVKFFGDNAVQPDLVVVLRDRAGVLTSSGVRGTPSLLLEILSPSNRSYDLTTKAELYARNGVPEYWVVDTEAETIAVHELRDGRYVALPDNGIARSRVIPDLAVDVRALFAAARVDGRTTHG